MRTLSNINSRKEAGLRCLVYDRPGGDTVIDQFVLGINMPAHCVQPLLDTWEHVRRFMQHEGPLFADETDKPNPSLGRQSLWRSLSDPVVFEIKSTIDMFKLGWEEKSLLILFMSMLSVALIPIIWIRMLFGLFPWLSGLFKREPKWPAEILASVGGRALSGRELAAMHHVLPFEADAVPAVDAGGTGVSDQEDR